MAPQPAFDLVITSTNQGYAVQASANIGAGDIATQFFALPFDLRALPQRRKDAAEWIARARVARLRGSEELREARVFGQALFEQLFTGEILAGLRASRAALPSGERLRLRLRLPPELTALPWELLCDPRDDQFLVLAPDLALVRHPSLPASLTSLHIEGPLQVVAVFASPDDADYAPIKLDRELRRIEAALKRPCEQGQIALDVIQGPGTLDQLRERLRRPVHVLHILSHGDLDEAGGEGVLIFEDADGAAEPVNAELLRQYLQRQRGQTQLVLLNACLGALPVGDDPFSSLGTALLRGGISAVIAMQFELAEDAAAELARVFYAELAAGSPVDLALSEARLHLYGRFRTRLDWAVPVLLLRGDDGVLFEPAAASDQQSTVSNTSAATSARISTTPVLDPSALKQLWQRALAAYFTRRWEEAERLLAQVAAADASYADVQVRLAEARRQLQLIALYQQARELRDAGQWQAVLGVLNELVSQQADYPDPDKLRTWAEGQKRRDVLYTKALDAYGRNDWQAAVPPLERLLASSPDDIDARTLLNYAHDEINMHEQREAAERIRREAAERERAFKQRLTPILTQIQVGNYIQALDVLEKQLKQQPDERDTIQLVASLIENVQIPLEQRLRAGRLAGQYGDPRPGVCTLQPAWCGPFPASVYLIAEGKRRVQLQDFYIARYPITVWQFRQFVIAKGYNEERWWTPQGKSIRSRLWPPTRWNDSYWTADNQPVLGLSWYEAIAFCHWLTAQGHVEKWLPDTQRIRLPSEAEWEVAAMWDASAQEMHRWQPPKNDRWQNVHQVGLGRTTPVGIFPQGASPCGSLDMAGNVWEWCASPYDDYPATAHQLQSDYDISDRGPVLRGNSYENENNNRGWDEGFSWIARCQRYSGNQDRDRGFRVVACSRSGF